MPKKTLSQRVAELEAELTAVKQRLPQVNGSEPTFVDAVWGYFQDDPAFVEAMRLGREYRESLRPNRRTSRKSKNVRPRH